MRPVENPREGEPLWLTKHRAGMVAHFISLRLFEPDYARYALETYEKYPGCPCPDIRKDVLEAWNKSKI